MLNTECCGMRGTGELLVELFLDVKDNDLSSHFLLLASNLFSGSSISLNA